MQILIVYLLDFSRQCFALSAKSKSHFLNRKLYPKRIVKLKFLVHDILMLESGKLCWLTFLIKKALAAKYFQDILPVVQCPI